MIIDTIENLNKYVGLNPLFVDVVTFLKDHDLSTMEPGKYPIKDQELFMNLQVAKRRTKDTNFERISKLRLESGFMMRSTYLWR